MDLIKKYHTKQRKTEMSNQNDVADLEPDDDFGPDPCQSDDSEPRDRRAQWKRESTGVQWNAKPVPKPYLARMKNR